ncbi:MAG TPA: substrate binding domain-containing protein [Myxococcota bacterium]|jgi:DNA-binding transcriptional LysR family regulator|nr:substrate binding domain-containing protein [Myxococcota bacterium]
MARFDWGLIRSFMTEHPKVSIEMDLTERIVDLVGERYDLALRTGKLPDSSLISRHLADSHFALFAHPEYLERQGQLSTPDDLQEHECLIFGVSVRDGSWELSSQRKRRQVAVAGRLATTSLETIFNACADGFGIGQLPITTCQALVDEGELVRILPAWAGTVHDLFLIYPSRTQVSPSVRAFIDYLVKQVDDALIRVE